MKILLFGKNGQVGWELQRALAPLGKIIALGSDAANYCGDFLNPAGIAETVQRIKPDVIVNAAAYTAVDKAEREPELAQQINADTVLVLAQEAKKLGAWLVHYSTDYVFNGQGNTPWLEDCATEPLNVYGASKHVGEQLIIQHCPQHLIFRTSWVYAARGNNFAKTMLRLAKERPELGVINDQVGAPTSAELIADCTAHAIRAAVKVQSDKAFAGVYHLTASGKTSWHDYAVYVFGFAEKQGVKLRLKALSSITTADYASPAQRPLNSQLNTQKFTRVFGLTLPPWQQGVTRMLTEIMDQN